VHNAVRGHDVKMAARKRYVLCAAEEGPLVSPSFFHPNPLVNSYFLALGICRTGILTRGALTNSAVRRAFLGNPLLSPRVATPSPSSSCFLPTSLFSPSRTSSPKQRIKPQQKKKTVYSTAKNTQALLVQAYNFGSITLKVCCASTCGD